MPTKRYRLKLEHPYAKKGTELKELVREFGEVKFEVSVEGLGLTFQRKLIEIPISTMDTWLEEVKEEVMYTKEQADAFQRRLNIMVGMEALESSQWYNETSSWLIHHTLKTDSE